MRTFSSILPRGLVECLKNKYSDAVFENVELASTSQWKTGGIAKLVVCPKSIGELSDIVAKCNEFHAPFITIGSSTNLLFDDDGLDILVIHIGMQLSNVSVKGSTIRCESGAWVPGLATKLARESLTGLEHIVGIPGTLGGLVCMNGGSLRRGVGENVTNVTTIDANGKTRYYDNAACQFAYRSSIFQHRNEIIAEVELYAELGDKKSIKSRMLSILRDRRRKFPRKIPNCGSVFVSDPAMYEEFGPPGKVIEQCGLKGVWEGNAEISNHHANFIVNHGGSTSEDILKLVHIAHEKVRLLTGYNMRSEAIFVSRMGQKNSVSDEAHRRFGT